MIIQETHEKRESIPRVVYQCPHGLESKRLLRRWKEPGSRRRRDSPTIAKREIACVLVPLSPFLSLPSSLFGIINSASAIGPWHTGWIVNSKPTGMHIFRGYKRVQGQGFFARYSPVVRADTNGTHGWALRVPSSPAAKQRRTGRDQPRTGGRREGGESLLFEDEGKCTSRSQHLRETRITDAMRTTGGAQRSGFPCRFENCNIRFINNDTQIIFGTDLLGEEVCHTGCLF